MRYSDIVEWIPPLMLIGAIPGTTILLMHFLR
jgi:hypothetical protein